MAKESKLRPIKTMEEFVRDWDKKITKIIASFGLQDFTEDIKQDIYLEMCTPDEDTGLNGLQAYDPNRGAFSTYVYGLVLVKVRNARTKRLRELGVMPYSHDSVEDYASNSDSSGSRARDRMESHGQELTHEISDMTRAEFLLQLADIRKALQTYPVRSYFFRNGECITRDLHTLLELILSDKSREEIVEYFQYSTGSVGVMYESLRQVPELRELRDMLEG